MRDLFEVTRVSQWAIPKMRYYWIQGEKCKEAVPGDCKADVCCLVCGGTCGLCRGRRLSVG